MAEKKKKSKFKKIVKNLLKAAALGTVGYGAAKMFGGPKSPVEGLSTDKFDMKAKPIYRHDLEDVAPKRFGIPDRVKMLPTDTMGGPPDKKWYKPSTWFSAKGGRAGAAKGGRVGVGIAKRGFGRALMKGKK